MFDHIRKDPQIHSVEQYEAIIKSIKEHVLAEEKKPIPDSVKNEPLTYLTKDRITKLEELNQVTLAQIEIHRSIISELQSKLDTDVSELTRLRASQK